MADKVILVVSFGTSYNNNRDLTIGAIENDIKEYFKDFEIRRAFTSQMIINKLKKRDNLVIDNVPEALERAVNDGVKTLIVQPTHMMDGTEYHYKIKDHLEDCYRIPMRKDARSLNLSNCVAIGAYECLRQIGFGDLSPREWIKGEDYLLKC